MMSNPPVSEVFGVWVRTPDLLAAATAFSSTELRRTCLALDLITQRRHRETLISLTSALSNLPPEIWNLIRDALLLEPQTAQVVRARGAMQLSEVCGVCETMQGWSEAMADMIAIGAYDGMTVDSVAEIRIKRIERARVERDAAAVLSAEWLVPRARWADSRCGEHSMHGAEDPTQRLRKEIRESALVREMLDRYGLHLPAGKVQPAEDVGGGDGATECALTFIASRSTTSRERFQQLLSAYHIDAVGEPHSASLIEQDVAPDSAPGTE